MSPSPWRAWIEIQVRKRLTRPLMGRPPRGGRGLKYQEYILFGIRTASPSPWRAWIEIFFALITMFDSVVALPVEGVD